MERDSKSFPTILVDFKKYRIRVHRCTMQWIKNPDCFLFLVNPKERIIAIQTCDASDARAHRNRAKQGTRQSFEVYSRPLLQQLRQCGQWEGDKAYKLTGRLLPQNAAILFRMNDAVEIKKIEGDKGWMLQK